MAEGQQLAGLYHKPSLYFILPSVTDLNESKRLDWFVWQIKCVCRNTNLIMTAHIVSHILQSFWMMTRLN